MQRYSFRPLSMHPYGSACCHSQQQVEGCAPELTACKKAAQGNEMGRAAGAGCEGHHWDVRWFKKG